LDLQQTELEPIAIEVLALAALEPEAALAAVVESFAAEQSFAVLLPPVYFEHASKQRHTMPVVGWHENLVALLPKQLLQQLLPQTYLVLSLPLRSELVEEFTFFLRLVLPRNQISNRWKSKWLCDL
jgi:hypothetical protein